MVDYTSKSPIELTSNRTLATVIRVARDIEFQRTSKFHLEVVEHGSGLVPQFPFAFSNRVMGVYTIGGQEAPYICCAAEQHGPQCEIPIVHVTVRTKPSNAGMQALPKNHITGRN